MYLHILYTIVHKMQKRRKKEIRKKNALAKCQASRFNIHRIGNSL